ncbi:hypothetical protein BC939DRAFT_448588 [Gamsiella multidivaricata]|uniref:uncharacterized protein n=1 Tax=Gamsiella multidivaricata TaxID=101098 RepID=UPI002220F301|nr:uncharacterized protein BC939DRAFT_448588 [Gamsiella multidivaricata]KAI7825349.1 hypothetical protein BC939DRAFT_448588 [Gamsiella multidivaricata]
MAIKTREGASEFETTIELALALNEICQNPDVQGRLEQVRTAYVDVVKCINDLNAKLAELEESNSASETQDPIVQEEDEVMAAIIREEGEIFALEEMLREKRKLLNHIQNELDGLGEAPESELMDEDKTIVEDDPELEAETAKWKLEIEELDKEIEEQRRKEEEQLRQYEELQQESDELNAMVQDTQSTEEELASPNFDEIKSLLEKAMNQEGDAIIQPEGLKESYLRLERLLDGLERCQRHIVNLDVLQQISSTLIDTCADPATSNFDPPLQDSVILAARTLQLIKEAGGVISLQDLKEQITQETVERKLDERLGVQAVYGLVASHLIQIDRSKKPNLVSFA